MLIMSICQFGWLLSPEPLTINHSHFDKWHFHFCGKSNTENIWIWLGCRLFESESIRK